MCKVWQNISKQGYQPTCKPPPDVPNSGDLGKQGGTECSRLDPVPGEGLERNITDVAVSKSPASDSFCSADPISKPPVLDQEGAREYSYFPLTMTVDVSSASELLPFVERHSSGHFQLSEPCMVVGLHTCGDLAVTVLRLFCEVASIKTVCVVGCCYNHCTENEDCTDGLSNFF